jgi:hypothetical protein
VTKRRSAQMLKYLLVLNSGVPTYRKMDWAACVCVSSHLKARRASSYCHNIDEITRGDFLTPPALTCLNRVAITTTLQSLEKQRLLSQIY